MKATTNRILRMAAAAMMLATTADAQLTDRQKIYINIVAAGIYEYLGIKGSKSNPDGTPAQCPWHPPSKK